MTNCTITNKWMRGGGSSLLTVKMTKGVLVCLW